MLPARHGHGDDEAQPPTVVLVITAAKFVMSSLLATAIDLAEDKLIVLMPKAGSGPPIKLLSMLPDPNIVDHCLAEVLKAAPSAVKDI